jgi:hypothetical protein
MSAGCGGNDSEDGAIVTVFKVLSGPSGHPSPSKAGAVLMRNAVVSLLGLIVAGCVQLPPTPADIEAKRFQPVAHKAVIYVVRQPMDSQEPGALLLDDGEQVTTMGGTYYRWVVQPGTREIVGLNPASVSLSLRTEPGKIYFVRQTVLGTMRSGPQLASLAPIDERLGRELVSHAQLIR